jgi:menaquinone-dependent protoporphyrinogen oxidase
MRENAPDRRLSPDGGTAVAADPEGMRVLLVFASTHGHTTRIAQRIATVLRRDGHHVSVRRIDDAPDDVRRWDAVVVGGSIHRGTHQDELVDWAHAHRIALGERPNAFFSVSLSAAEDTPGARAATRACIDRFVEDAEWDPAMTTAIAGALQYREYSAGERMLMRVMMHRGGHPDDPSRDYELTDWDQVEAFAHRFANQLDRAPAWA